MLVLYWGVKTGSGGLCLVCLLAAPDVSRVSSDWLFKSFEGFWSPPSPGAHRRCHAEHQPRRDGGWGRGGSGGRLWRRRESILGPRGREWPRGDARFPKSWTSRFSLHEQSRQPGTVLHRHVTETEPPDWTELSRLPVCRSAKEGGEVRRVLHRAYLFTGEI